MPGELIARLHAEGGFAVTLVKADGARMRWIKAPRDDEPVLPPGAATRAAGGLDQGARPAARASDRASDRARRRGHRRGARRAAASPRISRGCWRAPRARCSGSARPSVVPIVNMVDDEARRAGAREVASAALAATDRFERVVLTSMIAPDPVVEVIIR